MSQNNIECKTKELLEPIITDLNYILYDVQYLKDGKDYYLRITIDKDTGISIEDCEKVNNAIDDVLDNADFIKDSYMLEVSSPGIERNLRKPWHFEKQIGNEINVKLYQGINKKKELTGILKEYDKDFLKLQIEDEILEIENKNIAAAKTVADLF